MRENMFKVEEKNVGGFYFSVMIFLFVFISLIFQFALTVFGAEEKSVAYYCVNALPAAVALSVALLIVLVHEKRADVNKSKKKIIKLFFSNLGIKCFKLEFVLLSVLLSIGMFFGLGFVNTLFAEVLSNIGIQVPQTEIPLNSPTLLAYFTVTLAFLPAVLEELFFRGVIFKRLSRYGVAAGVLIAAFCFAFYHCSLGQFVYQLIYGVFLALLTERANSVIPATLSHFLNNGAVLFLTYFGAEIDFFNLAVIFSGLASLAVFVIIIFKRKRNKFSEKNSEVNGKAEEKGTLKHFLFPFGIFGIAVCFALIVGNSL